MKTGRKAVQSRGRSGGRSGGSGYDFQDLYVALHLAELLVADTRDPLREVLWEKKAIDDGGERIEAIHVDDVILHHESGAWTYIELKENAPRRAWSVRQFIESGVADQFWRQWAESPIEHRQRMTLRLATAADVATIRDIADVALRSRTPGELLSVEGCATATGNIAAIARALNLRADSTDLLAFLKTLDAVQLPNAAGLGAWIARTLIAFGEHSQQLADRLARLVCESKHAGHGARSSYTREALIERLLADGLPLEQMIGAGVIRAAPLTSAVAWSSHRAGVRREFESFRLYGLEVPTPVYADLATLFVPPRVAPTYPDTIEMSRRERMEMERHVRGRRGHWHDVSDEPDFLRQVHRGGSMELDAMLSGTRRFGFVAGPGTGKTTTLRWLALVSAMEDGDGRRRRVEVGLPAAPLIPVYVSFRQFARRVRARALEGVPGRVALVADFLAAQLESGLIGTPPSRERALQVAQWLLESDQTFLLFDGLDEVSNAGMRETLFTAVTDLVQTYEAPRVVIATRPSGIRALRLSANLPFFEPLPLDETRRTAFARRWYQAVRTQGGTLLDPQNAEKRGIDLGAAAEALSDLTSNPLLLSILALIHFNRGGLPVDRATLYDHTTAAMLGHWDRDAAGRDLGEEAIPRNWSDVLHLTSDQIRDVMEEVGWRLHVARHVELPVSTMTDVLSEAIAGVASGGSPSPKDRAAVMIQLLTDRSGLVLEREPGVLSFAHLSFRDYLAARYRIRTDAEDLRPLAALATEDAHDEVLRFALGILRLERPHGRDRTRALITQIAATAPTIAATGLLDAPEVDVLPATIEQLAHGVWMEAERGQSDPRTAPRLLRVLLARSTEPDRLLLSLLARTVDRGDQPPLDLPTWALLERPAGPLDAILTWVLRRLTLLPLHDARRHGREEEPHGRHMQSKLRAVASLLLVESEAAGATEYVDALAELLGDGFPGFRTTVDSGSPKERATRILLGALKRDATREAVQTRLRTLATTKMADVDQRAVVHLLVDAGVPATAPTVDVLMDALDHAWEREDAASCLARWLADPPSAATATRALERGLVSDSEGVRRTASRLLGRVDLPIATSNDRSGDDREEQERITRIVALLSNPATGEQTRAVLEDEIWDDQVSVAWQAARALAAADRFETPGLAQTFVRVGFGGELRQGIATDVLRAMLKDPRSARATRAALLEGTKHTNDRIAAVSGLFLLESGGPSGDPYLTRHLKAALRDTSIFQSAVPHLEALLSGAAKDAALALLVGYVRGDDPNSMIAGQISLLLAQHQAHDTHAVIRAVAMFGCAHDAFRPKAMTLLRGMLDDRQVTTETRRALGDALDSRDRDVAWSAARLLCERGSFTEPKLADVLASTGLSQRDTAEREASRTWIAELFARPGLAKRMRHALERAISDALHGGRYNKNYDLAWEAARGLVRAKAFEAEYLADTLVTGGFGERDRHTDAMTFLAKASAAKAELAAEIEEKLWKEMEDSDGDDVRWGAACALLDIFALPVAEMAQMATRAPKHSLPDREADKNKDEETAKALSAFAGLVRVLLNEETAAAVALERIHRMLASDLGIATRKALAHLVARRAEDHERTTAFHAAECLLRVDGYATTDIAAALIEGGLQNEAFRERASSSLDALRAGLTTSGIVAEALGCALWSSERGSSRAAAEYLVSRGDLRSPGVIRGLVRALANRQRRGWNPEAHVQARLREAETHDAAIGALVAALFDDTEEIRYDAARLLLTDGVGMTRRVLDVLDQVTQSGNAIGPLALLALTRRVEDVRAVAAEGRGALTDLVGDTPA